MMGKCMTAGMIGFLMGMKYKDCCKMICMKSMKRQMMKKLGL